MKDDQAALLIVSNFSSRYTSSMLGAFVLCGGMRRSMFDFYNARGRPADVNMGAGRHARHLATKSDEGNPGPS